MSQINTQALNALGDAIQQFIDDNPIPKGAKLQEAHDHVRKMEKMIALRVDGATRELWYEKVRLGNLMLKQQ